MKWTGLTLLLVGCTTTATITITPIQQRPVKHKDHHYIRHMFHARPRPTPTPTSSVSPAPPDPRIEDIIKSLKP